MWWSLQDAATKVSKGQSSIAHTIGGVVGVVCGNQRYCVGTERDNVGSQETTQEQNPKISRLVKDPEIENKHNLGHAGIQRDEK